MSNLLEKMVKPLKHFATLYIKCDETMVEQMNLLPKKKTLKYKTAIEILFLFLLITSMWLALVSGLEVNKNTADKICFFLSVIGIIQVVLIKLERERWWTISITFIQTGMDMRDKKPAPAPDPAPDPAPKQTEQ